MPKSSRAKTSSRPKENINNISTVHLPTPLIAVSKSIISSLFRAASFLSLILCSMQKAATFLTYCTLALLNPMALSVSWGVSITCCGLGSFLPYKSKNL